MHAHKPCGNEKSEERLQALPLLKMTFYYMPDQTSSSSPFFWLVVLKAQKSVHRQEMFAQLLPVHYTKPPFHIPGTSSDLI